MNVPFVEGGEHQQYVMNTITKSWCRFTDWDAEDFAVFNGALYFTSSTVVYKAWTGTADNGTNIVFYGKQAFQMFGSQEPKHCKLFLPILATTGEVVYGADVDVDFADDEITSTVTATVTSGAVWDTARWDQAYWATGTAIVKLWTSPSEYPGRWLSGKIKITTKSVMVQWMGSTMHYEVSPSI